MAEILSTVSIISYVAAALFGSVALVLWFLFKITFVIVDLSGSNAKKSIEQMRANNKKTGNKSYRSSAVNKKRGKLTEKMQVADSVSAEKYETGLLMENKAKNRYSEMTSLLVEEDTRPIEQRKMAKRMQGNQTVKKRKPSCVKVKLLEEVIFLHTDEKV